MEAPAWSSSLPSGRFDFARSRLALSTSLCSVSRPLPSTRAPQGGRLPAAEPSPPACVQGSCLLSLGLQKPFGPVPSHPPPSPAVHPDFAQEQPGRTVSVLVSLVAPFPRTPSVAVGAGWGGDRGKAACGPLTPGQAAPGSRSEVPQRGRRSGPAGVAAVRAV